MNNAFARLFVLAVFLIGGFGFSQAQPGHDGVTVQLPPPSASTAIPPQTSGEALGFRFISAEPAVSARVVKNAPYSLEAAIESVQTLSDGNRIVHRHSVRLYRDSEGRTRREETLAAIGPWAASGVPPTIVTIQDPVSGVNYFLDPRRKIATKLPSMPPGGGPGLIGIGVGGEKVTTNAHAQVFGTGPIGVGFVSDGGPTGFFVDNDGGPATLEGKSESLGKETIVGLSANGTRTSTTIPANTIGNEQPLQIIRETWYSPQLQIVLRSVQTDPRFGETRYEVTKLDKGTPSHSLFEVPSDYQLRTEPGFEKFGQPPR